MNNHYYGGSWQVHYPNSPIKWLIALGCIGLASVPFFMAGIGVGIGVLVAFLVIVATIAIFGEKAAAGLVLGAIFGFLAWLIVPEASGWVGLVAFLLGVLS